MNGKDEIKRNDRVIAKLRSIVGETEHGIQNAILELLAAHHIFAFRLNTSTMVAEHKGRKRFVKAHSLGAGAADILALVNHSDLVTCVAAIPCRGSKMQTQRAIWIEVKGPNGKQSAEQKSFEANVRAHGHRYLLVRDVNEVIEAFGLK